MDGERRVGVPPREARVPHALARVIEVRRRREFGEDAVVGPLRELVHEQRPCPERAKQVEGHQEAPSGAGSPRPGSAARWPLISRSAPACPCGSACGSTVLTSDGCHHRQKTHEQAEHREEEPEAPEQARHVPDRGREVAPGRREEITVQRRDDDHEPLEPHADVDDDRQGEQDRDARARLLEPEDLRADHVAADHGPVGPGVRSARAVHEREALVRVSAVPRGEELRGIGEADHRPGHEHDLRHVVEVLEGDDVLEAKRRAADHHERHHHGEAGEDRARDEVGREDRRMPSGEDRDREIHRDDRMNREDQRRREGREDEIGALVVVPLPHGAAPSEREETVDELTDRGFRPIAHRRQIRDQADVPEQDRDGSVHADRKDVPEKRAPEVGPHTHLVGDREHPVGDPDASHVDPGEQQRAHDREDGHRLRRAVDRGAPFLPEEEEDRRDERPGVPDADPEHEVRDVPRPADGDVESPDADPLPEEPRDRHAEKAEERERQG